jgi:hypothetical protein
MALRSGKTAFSKRLIRPCELKRENRQNARSDNRQTPPRNAITSSIMSLSLSGTRCSISMTIPGTTQKKELVEKGRSGGARAKSSDSRDRLAHSRKHCAVRARMDGGIAGSAISLNSNEAATPEFCCTRDPYHRNHPPALNHLLFPTETGTPYRIGNYLNHGSPKDAYAQLRHSKLEMTGWRTLSEDNFHSTTDYCTQMIFICSNVSKLFHIIRSDGRTCG